MNNDIVVNELKFFETKLRKFLDLKIDSYLENIVFAKSKRLRPLFGILFVKGLSEQVTEDHIDLFIAVELIHTASLIHDDIIDNADIRRELQTINKKYDNSLAVVSGDILLSLAMSKILNLNNKQVQNLIIKNMFEICQGEIKQYFSKFKETKIKEYIEKTRQKTSLLFEVSILGGLMLINKNKYYDIAKDFSKNFGIGFQIKNDLLNYQNDREDYKQGIYTAPVIYGKKNGIEKTKILINNYLETSIENLKMFPENDYTKKLNEIITGMKEEI